MSQIQLEHVNITVSDPDKTAAWMYEVFDWPVRWQGPALGSGGRCMLAVMPVILLCTVQTSPLMRHLTAITVCQD